MRILMPVLWFNEMPGGWSYFYEEALRLARAGHQVIVVCPHPGKPYQGPEDIRVYRCASTPLVARAYMISILGFVSTMRKVLLTEKTMDVVYDTTGALLPFSILCKVWFILKRRKTPILVHIHGEMKDLKGRGLVSLFFETYLNIVARITYTIADKVLVVDNSIAQRVKRLGADVRKIAIVKVGTKYSDSHINHHQPVDLHKQFNAKFVIGFVGRPTRAKGVDILLKSFSAVKSQMPSTHLVIIGEEREKQYMISLSDQLGILQYVHFLGYRNDVPELLSGIDIFVNLTQSEAGLSATQLEAMHAGLPSIVTSFSNYLTNMKEAIVVNRDDIKSISNTLVLLYNNPSLRTELGHNAVLKAEQVQKLYTWSTYISRINRLLSEVTHREMHQNVFQN